MPDGGRSLLVRNRYSFPLIGPNFVRRNFLFDAVLSVDVSIVCVSPSLLKPLWPTRGIGELMWGQRAGTG